jgi:hypothetical protein
MWRASHRFLCVLSTSSLILGFVRTSSPPLTLSARVRQHALSLPVSAYVQPRDIASLDYMQATFGVEVSEEPLVFCERLGARSNGSSFAMTLPLPEGDTATVFSYNFMTHPAWDTLDEVGQRIGVLYNIFTSEDLWAAPTFSDLAILLTDEVIEGNDPFATGTGTVSLNWADPVWALAHVRQLLSDEEQQDVDARLVDRHSDADLTMVADRTRAANVLKANLAHAADVLPFLSDAIATYIEERVNSNDIEDKPLSQSLLQTPRDDWENEVHRIVGTAFTSALTRKAG